MSQEDVKTVEHHEESEKVNSECHNEKCTDKGDHAEVEKSDETKECGTKEEKNCELSLNEDKEKTEHINGHCHDSEHKNKEEKTVEIDTKCNSDECSTDSKNEGELLGKKHAESSNTETEKVSAEAEVTAS